MFIDGGIIYEYLHIKKIAWERRILFMGHHFESWLDAELVHKIL